MKTTLTLIISLFLIASCNTESNNAGKPEPLQKQLYQLKTYTFDTDEQVSRTDDYLKNAFLPGLKRLGINKAGVFKPRPGKAGEAKKTLVLIPFSSFNQLLTLEDKLLKDQTYLNAGEEYINAPHDNPPYKRISSVILQAFKNMPEMSTPDLNNPRENRVYELRSYESATEADLRNKVDMFNDGGEIDIFNQLGFHAVFYAEVISGPVMPNLMYMTTYADIESRKEYWKSFGQSPAWETLKEKPKYQNNVSNITINFLYPTEYSDY